MVEIIFACSVIATYYPNVYLVSGAAIYLLALIAAFIGYFKCDPLFYLPALVLNVSHEKLLDKLG